MNDLTRKGLKLFADNLDPYSRFDDHKKGEQKKYNCAFTIAFEADSDSPEGDDLSPDMIASAIIRRVVSCMEGDGQEILQASEAPYDVCENF